MKISKSRISIYMNGCDFLLPRQVSFSSSFSSSSRSVVSSFSSSSRLRMRRFLIENYIPSKTMFGITLTLPWVWEDSLYPAFRSVIHRFRVSWLRSFPSCGAVFRVELQTRGAPHLHVIAWHDKPCYDDYFRLWLRAVGDLRGGSLLSFSRYGVKFDNALNITGAIRYLCDHATKSKSLQLGYIGKQWGVWGRFNFVSLSPRSFVLSPRQSVLVSRFLRKLGRFRVKSDCVFGSRLSHPCRSRRINYAKDSTLLKFLNSLLTNDQKI